LTSRLGASLVAAFSCVLGCSPLHDLDAVSRGDAPLAGAASSIFGLPGAAGSPPSPSGAGVGSGGSPVVEGGAGQSAVGGAASVSAGASAVAGSAAQAAGQGGAAAGGAAGSTSAGTAGAAGAAEAGGSDGLAALPIDLPNNPVTGTFTVAEDAEWEVNGTFVPTFEIHTPTASYWLVKSLGMLVSLTDPHGTDQRQWIDYSSSFRPLRGFPSFGTFGTPEAMQTTLDGDSQTPTHLRLFSTSAHWSLIWDFYPTHVTLTVTAAPTPYGLAFRGVLAGPVESTDRLVFADGSSQSAVISALVDLPGAVESAYLTDPGQGLSLFMLQHADDTKVDRYQVKDNDSTLLSFGDGTLEALPLRFSLGLVNSADYATVQARATFVSDAIH
jgi:hypothetical protein